MLRRTVYRCTTLTEARKLLFDTHNRVRGSPAISLVSLLGILNEHHKHGGEELVGAALRHLVQLDCIDRDTQLIASTRAHASLSSSSLPGTRPASSVNAVYSKDVVSPPSSTAAGPFLVLQVMQAYPNSAHIRECCCRCIANMCQLDQTTHTNTEATTTTAEEAGTTTWVNKNSSARMPSDAPVENVSTHNTSSRTGPTHSALPGCFPPTSLTDALVREGAVEQVLGTLSMAGRLSPRGRCWATLALLNLMCLSHAHTASRCIGEENHADGCDATYKSTSACCEPQSNTVSLSATARVTQHGGEDILADMLLSLSEELRSACRPTPTASEGAHSNDAGGGSNTTSDAEALLRSARTLPDVMDGSSMDHNTGDEARNSVDASDTAMKQENVQQQHELTLRALDAALGGLTALLASEAPDNGSGISYNAEKVSYAAVNATVSALVQLSTILMRAVVAHREPTAAKTQRTRSPANTFQSASSTMHTGSDAQENAMLLSETLSLVLPGLHKSWMALQLITRHAANLPMTYLALYEACDHTQEEAKGMPAVSATNAAHNATNDETKEQDSALLHRSTRECATQRATRLHDVCAAAQFVALESETCLIMKETELSSLPSRTRLSLLKTCVALTRASPYMSIHGKPYAEEDTCSHKNTEPSLSPSDNNRPNVLYDRQQKRYHKDVPTENTPIGSSDCTYDAATATASSSAAEAAEEEQSHGTAEGCGEAGHSCSVYPSHAGRYVAAMLLSNEHIANLALSMVMRVHSCATQTEPNNISNNDMHVKSAVHPGTARVGTGCQARAYSNDDFTTLAQSLLLLGNLSTAEQGVADLHTERQVCNILAVLQVVMSDAHRALHKMSCAYGKALATLFEPSCTSRCTSTEHGAHSSSDRSGKRVEHGDKDNDDRIVVSDEHRLAFIQQTALMGQVCAALSGLLRTVAGVETVCDMQIRAQLNDVYMLLSESYLAALHVARQRWESANQDCQIHATDSSSSSASSTVDGSIASVKGQTCAKETAHWIDNTAAESVMRVVGLMSKLVAILPSQLEHTESSK